ncbi:MAG: hypothetical protein DCF16_04605 [Alphaproteobacteria bacterium]|nr:MAG: hypothetical protein DCF16_04605 [Alphaproteobacteria bacterium]
MVQAGYVTDVVYGSAYTPSQAPIQLACAAMAAGVRAPDPRDAFNYLELCCGNGLTLCVLAACYPHARFHGVDFNGVHIAMARELAQRGGLDNVSFEHADLVDAHAIAARSLEFISVVGAFSWLDDARQQAVFARAASGLREDGLLHIHYASLPGAAQSDALHNALCLIAPAKGQSDHRLKAALATMADLVGTEAKFFSDNPVAARRLREAMANPAADEAHEIFSRGAGPRWFAQMYEMAAARGLTPVAEADTQAPIWAADTQAAEAIRNQTLRDIQLNRSARQDVYARAGVALAPQPSAFLESLRWYAHPRCRTQPTAYAARLSLSPSDAALFFSALAAGHGAREVECALGRPSAPVFLAAAHQGFIRPLVARTPVPAHPDPRLSAFNAYALELGLRQNSSIPLAATAVGTQIVLPLVDRLRLFVVCGGATDALLGPLDASSRALYEEALSESALAAFRDSALPELHQLGVLEVLG